MVRVVFLDVETTGLPRRGAPPTNLTAYATSRVVSFAWIIRDLDMCVDIVEGHHVVKPDGFIIPAMATQVHGITTEHAIAVGLPIADVFERFKQDLANYTPANIIAHNVSFDHGVLSSEMYRGGQQFEELRAMFTGFNTFCTMLGSMEFMGVTRWPKLEDLYKFCFPDAPPMQGAHDALYDTRHCLECFEHMRSRYPAFFP